MVPAKLNLLPPNQILNKNPEIAANLAVVWPVVMLMLKLSKGTVANDTKEHLSKGERALLRVSSEHTNNYYRNIVISWFDKNANKNVNQAYSFVSVKK